MNAIPRSEFVTFFTYVQTGSHKAAAHHLGISESASKQRVSRVIRGVGAKNAAQATWLLHDELVAEAATRGETFVHHQYARTPRDLRAPERRLP